MQNSKPEIVADLATKIVVGTTCVVAGSIIVGTLGFLVGGPPGAALGAKLGALLGGSAGGGSGDAGGVC
jgi:hypothetical protein